MTSVFCTILTFLRGSKLGHLPRFLIFLPFILALIPLLTVDKGYWERVKNKIYLAPLYLLDFVNNTTTALTVVLGFVFTGYIGYMHRHCIIVLGY